MPGNYYSVNDALFRAQTQQDLWRLRNEVLPANPVMAFTATPLPNSFGATIKFTLGANLTGCSQVNLLRNGVNDFSSALLLATYPLTAENANQDFQYIDADQALLQDQFYWAQTIPLPERTGTAQTHVVTNTPILSGPVQLSALNANLLPPTAFSSFSASLGASQGGDFQVCYISFASTLDPNFGSCQIQATNYRGDTNSVIVAQSPTSPFSFNLEQTGETITLRAFAISQAGIQSVTASTVTLTLNGTETPPGVVQNVRVSPLSNGVQIDFDAGAEPDITKYNIYRASHSAGFGDIVSDNFNRATLGTNWSTVSSVNPMSIHTSTDVQPGSAGECASLWNQNTPFPADQYSKFTLTAFDVTNVDSISAVCRASSNQQTFYQLEVGRATNTMRIWRTMQGTITLLVSASVTISVGGVVEFHAVGSSLMGFYNGALMLQTTDTSITAGQPGIRAFRGSAGPTALTRADNWSAGSTFILQALSSTGSRHYTVVDTGGLNSVPGYDYYVTAVSVAGESAASTVAFNLIPAQTMDQIGQGATYFKVPQYSGRAINVSNANFEASPSLPPPGWTPQLTTGSLAYETANPSEGTRSLQIHNAAHLDSVRSEALFPARVGDQYFVQASMKGDGTSHCTTSLVFMDGNNNSLGTIVADGGAPTSTSWNTYENSGVAPANTVKCQVVLQQAGATASDMWFDDIHVIRANDMDTELQDGSTFRRLLYVNPNNTISISTAFNPQGSIAPNQALSVLVTLSPTTLTITWSAQSVLRADGSVLNVPASTGSGIQYSGLSSSTKYFIYLYVLVATGVVTAANGNPPPTSPSSVLAAQAVSDGRFGLLPLSPTTQAPAGGGGSGGGDGGGGGSCPEGQELVEIERFELSELADGTDATTNLTFSGKVRAIEVRAGDFIKGWSFKQKDYVYRQVICTRHIEMCAWRIINEHKVSPCEPVWDGVHWLPAFKVVGATPDFSLGTRCDITVASDDYDESNYYLVDGQPLLIHNLIVLPC